MWSHIILARGAACLAIIALWLSSGLATEFKLLDPAPEAAVARIDQFNAVDAFRPGNKIGGRKLSAVGLSFSDQFLRVVETNVPAMTLRAWDLQYTMSDASLIAQLGGEDRGALPFLAYAFGLMEMGDGGPCHTDGRSNFAYMRSPTDGRLWAVHWTVNHADEWVIGAVYVPHPHLDWRAGSRLLTP